MEVETERTKPAAVFMAFGTKGDVYPIAVSQHSFLPFTLSVWFPRKCKKLKHCQNLMTVFASVVCTLQAIAAAFACDQSQYDVVLITHSAHEVRLKITFV